MFYNEINNILQTASLDYHFANMCEEIEMEINKNNKFMAAKDIILEIEERSRNLDDIKAMRKRCDVLLDLITKLNQLEMCAIEIKYEDMMWKCEGMKAKMIMQMQLLQDKYDI